VDFAAGVYDPPPLAPAGVFLDPGPLLAAVGRMEEPLSSFTVSAAAWPDTRAALGRAPWLAVLITGPDGRAREVLVISECRPRLMSLGRLITRAEAEALVSLWCRLRRPSEVAWSGLDVAR